MFAGIDIGSVTTKTVLLDSSGSVLAFAKIPTRSDREASGADCLEKALGMVPKGGEIERIVSTGYGRRAFRRADQAVPEIVCHAGGTAHLIPETRTIVDIGGQDSKIIELDERGRALRFEMNDKCAAGTGRFLEVLTDRLLEIDLDELGPLSLRSEEPCTLTSVCTVFAESEIISLLSEGRSRADVSAGMHRAIARRVVAMGKAAQVPFRPTVVFSGGVALNVGVVKAIEDLLSAPVTVPERPQITAALGAALLAQRGAEKRPLGDSVGQTAGGVV